MGPAVEEMELRRKLSGEEVQRSNLLPEGWIEKLFSSVGSLMCALIFGKACSDRKLFTHDHRQPSETSLGGGIASQFNEMVGLSFVLR